MILYREALGKEWRRWFAWRPVRTENFEWIWLEMAEKKIFNCNLPNVFPSSWIVFRKIHS